MMQLQYVKIMRLRPRRDVVKRETAPSRPNHLKTALARQLSRGVTLVEVLIVVAIMALIAGGVSLYVIPKYRQAKVDTARTSAFEVRKAAGLWRELKAGPGECPTVSRLIEDNELDKATGGNDPWGKSFIIVCEGDDIIVFSAGPDGAENTEDDVTVGAGPAEGQ